MLRVAIATAITIGLAACGARMEQGAPRPSHGESFLRPLDVYRELGFMTGTARFPVVVGFSTFAGPADSTYVLVSMSMPATALRFQRNPDGFFAEYRLDVTFTDMDSVVVRRFEAREVAHVATFIETGRTDETIIYQHAVAVPPGQHIVHVHAADVNSARGFRMRDTLTAPDYTRGSAVASPILAYKADGRAERDALPNLVVNPRNTAPYGGEPTVIYIESYGQGAAPLDVHVVDDHGGVVWGTSTMLVRAGGNLHYGTVEIPSDTMPLGRYWVEVTGEGIDTIRTPMLVTLSDQWVVDSISDIMGFLRYIAYPHELDSLRTGTPTERRGAWERFWERRDPFPLASPNEYRDQFFERVRFATEAFREVGIAGWNTDRGEVYIVLGPPDRIVERLIGRRDITGQPNAEEWVYLSAPGGRLALVFHDRTRFGRRELTPSSASSFREVADRTKPRPPRT